MRVAILSDIHGNLLALEAVLDDLAAAGGADAVIIAGDLCLGGPQPRETLERLRSLGYPIVQGNTDRDLALAPTETAGSDHAELLDWTRQQLGDEALAFLGALPFDHRVQDPTGVPSLQIVHANPQNLDDHLRPYSPDAQIAPLLEGLDAAVRVLAFGHLHIPFVREFGDVTLADIASVGQSKDGDRRANYGLLRWEDDRWAIEQRRVEYPVDEVVAQLREAAPPGADDLIKGLLRARYPNLTVARGGRPPKRRVAARPATVHAPQDSEALVTQIGPDAERAAASPNAVQPDTDSVDETAQVGEPIAAETTVAEGGTVGDDATSASSVEPSDATTDDAASDAVVTSDADLAATPILPPDDLEQIADDPAIAMIATGEQGDPDGEDVATTDADLAYAEDEAAPNAESEEDEGDSDEAGEDEENDQAEEDDDDEEDEEEQEDDEQEERDASSAEADRDRLKAEKKRRKRARKAAKAAAQAEAIVLTADGSFSAALPALLDSRLSAVLTHLEAVRQDEDPEAVHDMRVATRRLRAALVPAERFYGAKTYRKLARPVRELARALGRVRDADVLLAYLRERYLTVANDERAGIEGLIDLIANDRAAARDDLDPILDRWGEDGDRAATFVQLAAKAKARGKKGRDRVGVVALQALERDGEQFEERAAILTDEGASAEDFHDLRIAGKKLRYTIELFAPILGDDAAMVLTSLKSVQELLGEIHDRDVLVDLLAWERARALERQLHSLEFATFNPGTRDERLGATRQLLDAPDSFAATAIGIYGLLIDATSERDALEEQLRGEWGQGQSEQFVADLARLTVALLAEDDPAIDEPDDAAGEVSAALADVD